MTNLRQTLRRELTSRLGVNGPLDDDTPLFSGGLLDSLSVLELVSLVEKEIGQPIPPEEITLENFDSMNKITRFIETLGGRASS